MEIISDGQMRLTKLIDDAGETLKAIKKLTITFDADASGVQAVAECSDYPVKAEDGTFKTHLRTFWIKKLDAFGVELQEELKVVNTDGN